MCPTVWLLSINTVNFLHIHLLRSLLRLLWPATFFFGPAWHQLSVRLYCVFDYLEYYVVCEQKCGGFMKA